MIQLTRLNRTKIYLNPDLIKTIEEAPDTTLCLVNGEYYLVLEKAAEVVKKIIDFRVTIKQLTEMPDGLVQKRGISE